VKDPVLPASFDLLAVVPMSAWAAILLAALLTLARSTDVTPSERVWRSIAIVLLPLVGGVSRLIAYWIDRSRLARR